MLSLCQGMSAMQKLWFSFKIDILDIYGVLEK